MTPTRPARRLPQPPPAKLRTLSRRALLALSIPLFLRQCHNGFEDIPGETACQHRVVATVSSGLTPTISWTPICTVGYLHVADSTGRPSWLLVDSGSAPVPLNGIRSGITYGIVPTEAREVAEPATALVPGRLYFLLLRVSAIRGPGKFIDTTTFRP
jgi:hypothetical protein